MSLFFSSLVKLQTEQLIPESLCHWTVSLLLRLHAHMYKSPTLIWPYCETAYGINHLSRISVSLLDKSLMPIMLCLLFSFGTYKKHKPWKVYTHSDDREQDDDSSLGLKDSSLNVLTGLACPHCSIQLLISLFVGGRRCLLYVGWNMFYNCVTSTRAMTKKSCITPFVLSVFPLVCAPTTCIRLWWPTLLPNVCVTLPNPDS